MLTCVCGVTCVSCSFFWGGWVGFPIFLSFEGCHVGRKWDKRNPTMQIFFAFVAVFATYCILVKIQVKVLRWKLLLELLKVQSSDKFPWQDVSFCKLQVKIIIQMILLLEYLYIFINILSTTGEFLQTFAVINFLYQWCETWRNTAHTWQGNYKGRGSRKERQGNKILRSRQGDLTNLLCISSASFNPCDFNLSVTGGFRQNKPRSPSTTYTKPQPHMHPGIQVCRKTSLLVFMYSDACWTFNLTGSFMMKDIDLEPRSMLWYIKGSCSDTNIFMYSAETARFTTVLKMRCDQNRKWVPFCSISFLLGTDCTK